MRKTFVRSKKPMHTIQINFSNNEELKSFMEFLSSSENESIRSIAKSAKLVNEAGEIYQVFVGNKKILEGSFQLASEIFEKQLNGSQAAVAMKSYRNGSWVVVRERKKL